MGDKLKAIILIIALVIGGIFIANMPSNDKSLKRKNNELKTQITELSNLNSSLKEQNKVYESTIGDLQEQLENSSGGTDTSTLFDLTDTTWVLNEKIYTTENDYFSYDVNFSYGSFGREKEASCLSYSMYTYTLSGKEHEGKALFFDDFKACGFKYGIAECFNDDTWRIIHIKNGKDVTNNELIIWLFKNARLYSNLITFTIDGIEYQADAGMYWFDWVLTPFNANAYTGNGVQYGGVGTVVGVYEYTELEDGASFNIDWGNPDEYM